MCVHPGYITSVYCVKCVLYNSYEFYDLHCTIIMFTLYRRPIVHYTMTVIHSTIYIVRCTPNTCMYHT